MRLLHLEAAALGVQMNPAIKFIFGGGEASDFGLRFSEFELVRSEFVFGGGLLRKKALQSIMTVLQSIAVGNLFCQIAGYPRGIIGTSTGIGGAEIVLGFQEAGAGLGKRCGRVSNIQLQQELTFLHLLAFDHGNFFHECVELRANHVVDLIAA